LVLIGEREREREREQRMRITVRYMENKSVKVLTERRELTSKAPKEKTSNNDS
jgi:hypothetical protein